MSLRAPLLLTGATGQVGGELLHTLAGLGTVIAPTRAEMNLADPESIRALVRAVRPRWIINAAAYTAVDRAEAERDLAYAINRDAVRVLGEEAHLHAVPILHFSTDYVFDGRGNAPWRETDETGPLGVYGASKRAGELALRATGAAALIFRTSWVFGATGTNFLRTILRLAKEREELRIVADQFGSPTWSRDLAELAAHVITRIERPANDPEYDREALVEVAGQMAGVYHSAGTGETSWAGFAEEALRQQHRRAPEQKLARVVPISTAEYPTAAARPANSRLSGEKLFRVFGYTMMDWRQSLARVLAELE